MAKAKKGALKSEGKAKKSDPAMDELRSVLDLMKEYEVHELAWETGGRKIHLKTGAVAYAPMVAASAPALREHVPQAAAPLPTLPVGNAATQADKGKTVVSPFVGTFYRAATPGASPYVSEGKQVKAGDVLCIVEAMKLMNEIEAEFSGKIVQILVENGQPVEFGEPLFVIEPS